jgi:hypothetical protein
VDDDIENMAGVSTRCKPCASTIELAGRVEVEEIGSRR